jgi:hypothetical protein
MGSIQAPTRTMAAYRAPSLLQPHFLRQAIADAHAGKINPLTCFYCGLPSTAVAKLVAQLGFDVAWIDWEHAAMGVETMTQVGLGLSFTSSRDQLTHNRWSMTFNLRVKERLSLWSGKLILLLGPRFGTDMTQCPRSRSRRNWIRS